MEFIIITITSSSEYKYLSFIILYSIFIINLQKKNIIIIIALIIAIIDIDIPRLYYNEAWRASLVRVD